MFEWVFVFSCGIRWWCDNVTAQNIHRNNYEWITTKVVSISSPSTVLPLPPFPFQISTVNVAQLWIHRLKDLRALVLNHQLIADSRKKTIQNYYFLSWIDTAAATVTLIASEMQNIFIESRHCRKSHRLISSNALCIKFNTFLHLYRFGTIICRKYIFEERNRKELEKKILFHSIKSSLTARFSNTLNYNEIYIEGQWYQIARCIQLAVTPYAYTQGTVVVRCISMHRV